MTIETASLLPNGLTCHVSVQELKSLLPFGEDAMLGRIRWYPASPVCIKVHSTQFYPFSWVAAEHHIRSPSTSQLLGIPCLPSHSQPAADIAWIHALGSNRMVPHILQMRVIGPRKCSNCFRTDLEADSPVDRHIFFPTAEAHRWKILRRARFSHLLRTGLLLS